MHRLLVLVSLGLFAAATSAQPAREQVSIQQVQVAGPDIRLYLDLTDAKGASLSQLTTQQVSVVGGSAPVEVKSVRKLSSTEDVAYVVLVDVSRSTKPREQETTAVLQRWVRQLTGGESMAIITFGDDVQVKQDFTSRQELLLAATNIEANAQQTQLFSAVQKAFELSRRQDKQLPFRRAIILLSDGKNDEKSSGLKENDIVGLAQASGVPFFAIDSGRPGATGCNYCYPILSRLATVTGGRCEQLGRRSISESFDSLRKAIRDVFVVEAKCAKCDRVPREITVQLRVGDSILPSRAKLLAVGPDPEDLRRAEAEERRQSESRAKEAERLRFMYAVGGGLIVVLLLVLGFGLWRSRKKPEAVEVQPPAPPPPLPPAPPPPEVPAAIPTESPAPPPPANLEFIVVGGSSDVRHYQAALSGNVLLGYGPQCQIRIQNDPEMSEQQCEFFWSNEKVFVRPIDPDGQTYVGGGRLRATRPIEHEEVLRVGRTNLRMLVHVNA